jgi:hypothetical protein
MTASVLLRVSGQVLLMEGSRANQRHVSPKNIPQLGKFVQTPSSQECAKTGETLMIGEGAPVTGLPFRHRSELVEREEFPIEPRTTLTKEDWSTHSQHHKEGKRSEDWSKSEESTERNQKVEGSLQSEGMALVGHGVVRARRCVQPRAG